MDEADGPRRAHPRNPAERCRRGFGRIAEALAIRADRPARLHERVEIVAEAAPEMAEADLADEPAADLLLDREDAVAVQRPMAGMAHQPRALDPRRPRIPAAPARRIRPVSRPRSRRRIGERGSGEGGKRAHGILA